MPDRDSEAELRAGIAGLHVEPEQEGAAAEQDPRGAGEEPAATIEALRKANAALEGRVAECATELSTARAQLEDTRARLSLALRVAEAGTWDWDMVLDTVAWSEEYWDLYGLAPGEVVPSHRAWLETILPEDRAGAQATLQACLDARQPDFAVEYRIRHPRKGVRWLAGRGRFLFDAEGRPVRMIGLNIDITARKEALAALDTLNRELTMRVEAEVSAREATQRTMFESQKLEALGQLTGGVAHDFNNLLTVVISGLHLLDREQGNLDRRRRLLERVLGATERAADLTRRLLAFGRRQELRPVAIDLPRRLREIAHLLAHSLGEDIRVETACPDDAWRVHADPAALELALLNVAVNARDAMPQGGLITIAAANRVLAVPEARRLALKPGGYVELRVADTGTGMPEDVRAHAFEPFFTTKQVGKGTGLGLAQVYGFALQSGGTVRIESECGRGTTVVLLLPRAGADAPAERRTAGDDPVRPRPIRLLVVEDDAAVAEGLVDLLAAGGHEVTRAADVDEAVRVLASPAPLDLVLTDVLLSAGQSGADVVREVRQRRPGLPIVLTTGYAGKVTQEGDLAALPMLCKPYTPDDLATTLARAVAAAEHAAS